MSGESAMQDAPPSIKISESRHRPKNKYPISFPGSPQAKQNK